MRPASSSSHPGVAGSLLAFSLASTAPWAAEPKVVVTIKPLHALVAQVMAGVGVPELLVKGSASPHTYALRPSRDPRAATRRPVRAHVRDGGAVHGQDREIAAR